MQLTFLYEPTADPAAAAPFYRDVLGWEEAWRDGDKTVAFWLPGRVAKVMLSTTDQPAGPMYLVDDLDAWISEHDGVTLTIPSYAIPAGSVAGFADTDGNAFYVFDQPDA